MTEHLTLYKGHQAGNDFLFAIGCDEETRTRIATQVAALCHRHTGVGADGLIFLCRCREGEADFRFELYNADGSKAELSGNGLCLSAKMLYDFDFIARPHMRLDTVAGIRTVAGVLGPDQRLQQATVAMPLPSFLPASIPLTLPGLPPDRPALEVAIPLADGARALGCAVNVGNPHFVWFLPDGVSAGELHDHMRRLGPELERHPAFPARANVQFASVTGPGHLTVFPHERGVGPTLACGSGATATVCAAVERGLMPASSPVAVTMPGGTLGVTWDGRTAPMLTGSPVVVATVDLIG